MEILLYKRTFDRIAHRLAETSPAIAPVVMNADGSLSREGKPIEVEDAKPELAFACTDLYSMGPVTDFMICLLKSATIRWIQSGAAGFDHPIFKSLAEKGIRLTNSNATATAIAEFVMASVLTHLHPFDERRDRQAEREWKRIEFQELSSRKWLIVGLGNIGRRIAVRAAAFGCHVTGVRRTPTGDEPATATITPDRIPDVLPDSDVVVLSAALNDESKLLVDRSFLKAMKPTSILVNIARGSMIDEKALLESLDRGIPAHAILDVFETEPLPEESPFWAHPRVQVTAHCSAFTPEKTIRGDALFLENLKRYLEGKTLEFEVDLSEL
ncbi:MAG: D-2-hydroxyacid dehydrogenase [Proteobacteria bacterium]|nr:D-2-hydroxyacid dehydrogenase [Pseudomonadota bacterium]